MFKERSDMSEERDYINKIVRRNIQPKKMSLPQTSVDSFCIIILTLAADKPRNEIGQDVPSVSIATEDTAETAKEARGRANRK
ncbi:rCG41387 [Rattus norvegicus]|uniref:RCG41387 n=1 Tax=Rattus norvegicus TaxID=10116 RepID=A6IHR9_RAT|nr:rCG41387 [Rattus norvegicus]